MATSPLTPGFQIGHATDTARRTGTTVVVCDRPTVAACHVAGGAPGTRETDLLAPDKTVQNVDAITLSGGSAFGLDAASGVQAWLREQGRGFPVGKHRVPIVPAAILFDLSDTTTWDRYPPYRELGYNACKALTVKPALGSVGAGTGATTATAKGGFGMAHTRLPQAIELTAAVAVNAVGNPYVGRTRHFWAAPFEHDNEFGGRGYPEPFPLEARELITKGSNPRENTTISVLMTNATLTQAECQRLAVMVHDGYTRALYPAHTPMDGDLVFVLAAGRASSVEHQPRLSVLGTMAANTMARAIARGVYEAESP